MSLVLVGLSHKTAGIELREQLGFLPHECQDSLKRLVSYEGIQEAVIVATCNRTEIYVAAFHTEVGIDSINSFLADVHGLSPEDLEAHFYRKTGEDTVAHLFEVVSSLDSMVLGEAQIQGQVREAYQLAQETGTTGTLLNQLFKQALVVGKRVRSLTDLGAHSVSLSTAAINLVRRISGPVETRSILIVGAGEMAALALTYLSELGAQHVFIANRSLARAEELAERYQGEALTLDCLPNLLHSVDIVLSSTAAPGYVITAAMLEEVHREPVDDPLLLIDLALPRDIEPCNKNTNVQIYDLDNLQEIIALNREEREEEAAKARLIVSKAVEEFKNWYQALSVKPTIVQIRQKAEGIVDTEVERALKRMASGSTDNRVVLEAMAQAIVKKVLHGPTARLGKQAANPDAYQLTETARYLFGLDANPDVRTPCNKDCDNCQRQKDVELRSKGLLTCQHHRRAL